MEDVRGLTGVGSLVFIKNLRIMSDFINQLPPSLREAIERRGNEDVAEQINALIEKEKAKEEFEESKVEEFTKAMRQ